MSIISRIYALHQITIIMRKLHIIEVLSILGCLSFIGVFIIAALMPSLSSYHTVGMTSLDARLLWHTDSYIHMIVARSLLIASAVFLFSALGIEMKKVYF